MDEADRQYLKAATGHINRLLAGRASIPLRPQGLSPELQAFGADLDRLLEALEHQRRFAIALGNGDLDHEAPSSLHLLGPLKHLQANLRHLTWQTRAIAAGDLEQRLDFLGEFSAAFNQMILGLRDKRRIEEQIRRLSLHDTLTGLHNRTFFNQEMERLRSSANHFPISLIMADLDGLKAANDHLGHGAGDQLIQRAARLLEQGVRARDEVTRIGGDEFVIILYRADDSAARLVMGRIRGLLASEAQTQPEPPVRLSLGAGVAAQAAELDAALAQADAAMYEDKAARKAARRDV